MFNVFYDLQTGYITGYQEGDAINEEGVLVVSSLDNLQRKRVNPQTKQLQDKVENLIGEPRSLALYREAVKSPSGCFVEIGVYKGGSAWYLLQAAKELNRSLHLYDTFTGIPYKDDIDPTPVNCFNDVNADEVKNYLPGAVFHIGVFPETLTDDISDISFVHFDGDQYRGVKDVKKYLWPRLVKGGKIFFDDSSLHGGMAGVNKAIDEEFPDYKIHDEVKMKYVEK